jgi:hypothetical protein
MNQEMSDSAVKAIIGVVVVAALVGGFLFIKRSDPASQPFGVAPAGEVQKAMQEARSQQQQAPRGAPPNASGSGPAASASQAPASR